LEKVRRLTWQPNSIRGQLFLPEISSTSGSLPGGYLEPLRPHCRRGADCGRSITPPPEWSSCGNRPVRRANFIRANSKPQWICADPASGSPPTRDGVAAANL